MKSVILGGRLSGKTYRLCKEVAKRDGAVLVVANDQAARAARTRIAQFLEDDGYEQIPALMAADNKVITPAQRHSLKGDKLLFVDDAEHLLTRILGQSVEMISASSFAETPQGKELITNRDNPHIGWGNRT